MRNKIIVSLLVLNFANLLGCATVFKGEAKFKNGPKDCVAKCQQWGMDLVGMVAMGEYSEACICQAKGQKVSLEEISPNLLGAAPGGGAAGVMMQMQRSQQQQSQNQMHQQQMMMQMH